MNRRGLYHSRGLQCFLYSFEMQRALLAILVFYLTLPARANEFLVAGSRQLGMGSCRVTAIDVFSAHNNPAASAFLKEMSLGLHSERRFADAQLSHAQLALVVPLKNNAFALDVSYFGYSKYNETHAGLSYARSFAEKFSMGIQFNYLRMSTAGYKTKHFANADLGVFYNINKKFSVAAHATQLIRWKVSDDATDRLPLVLSIGAAYHPSEIFTVCVELEKNSEKPLSIKAGAEYRVAKKVFLRAGFHSGPVSPSLGVGLQLKNLKLDVASAYHLQLGFTPGVSLQYAFVRKKSLRITPAF